MKNEVNKMTKSDTFLMLFAFVLMLGFIDILWLFGVENSKEYTWWYVLHVLGGK